METVWDEIAGRHCGETFVIKIGGEALRDLSFGGFLDDVAVLQRAGARLLVVHGGGPQATELTHRMGLEPRLVGGRRVTDAPTLEIMKMVLAGQIGTDLAALCKAHRIRAVSVSGVSGGIIEAVRRPPRAVSGGGSDPIDFGYVGDIVSIDASLLEDLLAGGWLPLMSSLGADAAGEVLNINADIAATRVAAAIGASKLLALTGAPGVLRHAEDPTSLIPDLTVAEARRAIADGVVGGGMIPKLEESFVALAAGVAEVHIFSAATPHALLLELTQDRRTGTRLRA